jgi:mannose-6-phosphate isomerase-like protein (cupin superfamily)
MKMIKFKVTWVIILVAAFFISASDFLLSGVYRLEDSKVVTKSSGWSSEILKGQTRSLAMFEIRVVSLLQGKGLLNYIVEPGVDEMFIVMEGNADIIINNKSKPLPKGSVAVIPQGEKIRLRNSGKKEMIYFIFRFKTGIVPAKKVAPFISVWDTVTFRPSVNGGRRNIMNQETSGLKNLEIHVTTLKEGVTSHEAHTHPDEEIILMRKGTAEESIGAFSYSATPGCAILLTNDDKHGIKNIGKGECEYYAIRWITRTDANDK